MAKTRDVHVEVKRARSHRQDAGQGDREAQMLDNVSIERIRKLLMLMNRSPASVETNPIRSLGRQSARLSS